MSKFGILPPNSTLATDFFDIESLNNHYAATASKHKSVSQTNFLTIFTIPRITPPTFSFRDTYLRTGENVFKELTKFI